MLHWYLLGALGVYVAAGLVCWRGMFVLVSVELGDENDGVFDLALLLIFATALAAIWPVVFIAYAAIKRFGDAEQAKRSLGGERYWKPYDAAVQRLAEKEREKDEMKRQIRDLATSGDYPRGTG